jgi:hypothetical protein
MAESYIKLGLFLNSVIGVSLVGKGLYDLARKETDTGAVEVLVGSGALMSATAAYIGLNGLEGFDRFRPTRRHRRHRRHRSSERSPSD